MRNIKLTIQYDGTRYAGWQSQKNGRSIQDTIEKAIRKITGRRSHLTASGRTDAGVHAKAQVANFKTRSKIPLKNLQMAFNTELPKDIVVTDIEEVSLKFDAQRSAKSKLYCYTIANENFVEPLLRHFVAKCFYKLDIGRMVKAAKMLAGRHDFKAFQAKDKEERDSVRTIKHISVEKCGKLVYIYMEADGFLYNMARNITGTLIEVGRGKISPESVREILKSKDRRLCGPKMPAKGLCLLKVKY